MVPHRFLLTLNFVTYSAAAPYFYDSTANSQHKIHRNTAIYRIERRKARNRTASGYALSVDKNRLYVKSLVTDKYIRALVHRNGAGILCNTENGSGVI